MGSPSHIPTRTQPPGVQLLGRQRERAVLAGLLDGARAGEGGVLVVHGEPGVGKTALLDWMVEEGRQLPELRVEPLGHRDARTLLESVLPARLDEDVLDRIVLETHGNPLALLELPRGLTPIELAGGFGLPAAAPLSASIEESFTRRLARLPDDARRLLLVAAADPTGDPAVVWRAARELEIPESIAETVEAEDLLELGVRVVFRHPLVRSAIYRAAGLKERRAVHRALAEATDPEIDPDRRAWHRAQAASMPDEHVAAELERSAVRAQARGGLAAVAASLERAA